MGNGIMMYSKAEQKFITYHQNMVKKEKKRVYDLKREMADKCHERFISKFGDELIQVGFSPDQVSSEIQTFESAIIAIDGLKLKAQSNGNIGRDIKFYILKKCRNCNNRYEEYKVKEEIKRLDDVGRLLTDNSDDHLCWDCHKKQQEGKLNVQDNG